MLKSLLLLPAIALVAAFVPVAPIASPAPQDPQAPQDPRQAEAMREMMERARRFTQPGPNHEVLERFLGEWDVSTRFFMGEQPTPPETARASGAWLIDGRWLQMRSTGRLMGQQHQSFAVMGYDNFKQSFVVTMVQSIDTAMLRSEGDLTPDGAALITYGTLDEYLTGEHDKMVKYVWRFVSDDEFVLEVHDLPIGESNTKVVESRYTRRKS
ncbi:MAG: DUF1579 family protein [Planctomycetes bacterium]|nr:DUF1579 family protein [Planctomycetota bacterium]